jgi:hypothetical protein
MGGLLMLLLAPSAFSTTTIVLLDRSKNRIVLAADSLIRIGKKRGRECKIVSNSNCTFLMAGIFSKPRPNFDLKKLAQSACEQPGDLRGKADAFLDTAGRPVMELVQYLHNEEPEYYMNNVATEKDFIVVIFVGTNQGQLAAFPRGYRVDKGGAVRSFKEELTYDKPETGAGFFGGSNAHVTAYVNAHPKWRTIDYTKAAKRFVQLEIDANPNEVGQPISVATVDWLGNLHWVEQGVCRGEGLNPKK